MLLPLPSSRHEKGFTIYTAAWCVNPSLNFQGHVLNEYWAKCPDFINNLTGIMLRFVGEIKHMYHTIHLSEFDEQTHRYLWHNFQTENHPETFILLQVSFADKPASAIACLALRKTALMNRDNVSEAEQTILNNTYVDDR